MTHIGVERLGTGNREDDSSKQDETLPRVCRQQLDAVIGVERPEDLRLLEDLDRTKQTDNEEPQGGDRSEETADHSSAAPLHEKEAEQQDDGDRQNIGLEDRRRDFESLDGAQDRDRRGDYAIAIKKRCTDQAGGKYPAMAASRTTCRAQRQRCEGQDATLAAIVGAHDDDDVF